MKNQFHQSNLKNNLTINVQPLKNTFQEMNLNYLNHEKNDNQKMSNELKIKKHKGRELGNRGYVNEMRKIPFLGIFFAILYAFFMSTSVALLKIIPNLHPITVLVFRSIIQCLVFLLVAFYNQKSLFGIPDERIACAGRAVSGMINQVGWYTSVKYISLTDSSAIYYSAPVFVTVLAYFMLNETFGIFEFVSVLITVIGVMLVSKPRFISFLDNDFTSHLIQENNDTIIEHNLNERNINSTLISNLTLNFKNYMQNKELNDELNSINQDNLNTNENYHLIGMLLALLGAITFALSNIYIRQMKKTPTEITAIWFSFVTILSGIPLMYFLNVITLPQNYLEWIIIFLIGIFSVLGQVAFTLALKIEKAGPVSVAQTLNIVIVLFYQIVFFQNPITNTSLIGVFFIIISVMIIGLKDIFINNHSVTYLIKKLSKNNNGEFNVEHAFKFSLEDKSEKSKTIFYKNYYSNNFNSNQTSKLNIDKNFFVSTYCIGGNCKNNECVNSASNNILTNSSNDYLNKTSKILNPKCDAYNQNINY